MLRQPCEWSVDPHGLIGGGYEQDEQERARRGSEHCEHGDQQARPLQRLKARRPQFMRRTRQGVTATDGGQRQSKAEQVDQHGVE